MTDPLVVGIVTFNNLPMIQRCFESWRKIPNSHLVVWDNGSEPDVIEWLQAQQIDKLFLNPTNAGLCIGRNRIIEYNREIVRGPNILLMDSDVLFHDGSAELMQAEIVKDGATGMVGFAQANQGFPMTAEGYVEEASNECILSKMEMWREIGTFPECLVYFSSDSWKSTLANMHGWRTKLIASAKGYDHFAHGSHVNKGVGQILKTDQNRWLATEARMEAYWRQRLLIGKGNLYKADMSEESNVDWKVADESFDPDNRRHALVQPTVLTQFTNWFDCQALCALMGHVQGNYLEVGCHQGLTLMQLAYNFPDRTCYGIDFSGPELEWPPEQQAEKPNTYEIGWQVRAFRNTHVFDVDFNKFGMSTLDDVSLAFIDADLSYKGVKAATERVLEYYYKLPPKKRIIAWHDYVPKRDLTDANKWIGVGEYVRKEIADRFVCRFIRGTNVAYMYYTGVR
jgi:glycosyltransferase involved in cell wall biosynthesis